MNKKAIIFLAVIVIAFIGLLVLGKQKESSQAANAVGSNNVYGKADSPVTLTEFVDFQCEACYAFYPTVKEVKEKYKDQVRFEIKYFPIASSHANALAAAATAQAAAKQDKFFEMHDLLFERQNRWSTTSASNRSALFRSYAKELDLNLEQFDSDVTSRETQDIIQADLAEVKQLGGDGTPTFALNGKKIDNPENTVEAISELLDSALAEAE